MTVNFKLVSEFLTIHRRSFALADPDILKPIPPSPKVSLVDGEYLELNDDYKMARGTNNPTTDRLSFVWAAEQGRYETQALGKGPVLYGGWFEADTLIMDATNIVVGSKLEVSDITIGGIVRRALKVYASGVTVGRCTRLPAKNNNFLRFIRVDGDA